jgi:hypothetical protein
MVWCLRRGESHCGELIVTGHGRWPAENPQLRHKSQTFTHAFKRQLPKIFLLLFERSRAPSFARERGEKEEQGGGSKQSSPISDRSEFQSNGQGNLAEWNRQLFPLLGDRTSSPRSTHMVSWSVVRVASSLVTANKRLAWIIICVSPVSCSLIWCWYSDLLCRMRHEHLGSLVAVVSCEDTVPYCVSMSIPSRG